MITETPARIAYRTLCRQEAIPLFSQDWWLDAVCGASHWDVAVVEKGGQVAAAWPFHWQQHWFLGRRIVMPPLTQTMGPWLRYPPGQKPSTRLGHEAELIPALLDAMPHFAAFRQNLHHSLSNWLPLYWQGFRQTTRYTYILPRPIDATRAFDGMDGRLRREIKKAEKQLRIEEHETPDEFIELNRKTFARQGMALPYSPDLVRGIADACRHHGGIRITVAKDDNGRPHGSIFVVWSSDTAYYLMGGADPELRTSGVSSLLLWDAIRHASALGQSFDFEGSMIEPIERFFRAFGSIQTPYSQVWRGTRTARLWEAVGLR